MKQTAKQIINVHGTANLNVISNQTFQQVLNHCEHEISDFINNFPDTLVPTLTQIKQVVYNKLLSFDSVTIETFLARYRFPTKHVHHDHAGVAELWKFLIMCQTIYPHWELDNNFITQNICLDGENWVRIVCSCWGQQSMPKIIIRLARDQQLFLKRKENSLFPHKLIIKNSDSRKDSLCRHCGNPIFPFDKILRDFGRNDDISIFKSMGEENSFKILENIDVYDGNCIYIEVDQAKNVEELDQKIRRVL